MAEEYGLNRNPALAVRFILRYRKCRYSPTFICNLNELSIIKLPAMLRKPAFATIIVTAYLLLYYVLFHAGASENIIMGMFMASPVLVIWLAVTILKYGKFTGTDLPENEEWGYQDRDKDSLGTF